jgi:hypothetical protein
MGFSPGFIIHRQKTSRNSKNVSSAGVIQCSWLTGCLLHNPDFMRVFPFSGFQS